LLTAAVEALQFKRVNVTHKSLVLVEVHHNLKLWSLVQTLQIVMEKNRSFSPVVGSNLARFSSKMFLCSDNSLSEYNELAGVAKNFLASLVKPIITLYSDPGPVRSGSGRIRKFWIRCTPSCYCRRLLAYHIVRVFFPHAMPNGLVNYIVPLKQ